MLYAAAQRARALLVGTFGGILIAMCVSPPCAAAQVTVSLKPRAEAPGKLVRVSDIARVEGDEPELVARVGGVLVGAVPDSGDIKTIARNHVQARLYQEGLSLSDIIVCGENWVAVTAPPTERPAVEGLTVQVGSGSGLMASVRAQVAEELHCEVDAIDVDLLSLQWTRRPERTTALQYAVTRRTSGSPLGRAHYIVDALHQGQRVGRALVWVETVQYRTAVAARRTMKPQDVIGMDDLVVVTVPVREVNTTFLSDPSRVAGCEAATRIKAHEPIRPEALSERHVIKRGDVVTVLVETPYCKIADQARAQKSGALGQVIPVVNLRSNKTYMARVIDDQMVAAVP